MRGQGESALCGEWGAACPSLPKFGGGEAKHCRAAMDRELCMLACGIRMLRAEGSGTRLDGNANGMRVCRLLGVRGSSAEHNHHDQGHPIDEAKQGAHVKSESDGSVDMRQRLCSARVRKTNLLRGEAVTTAVPLGHPNAVAAVWRRSRTSRAVGARTGAGTNGVAARRRCHSLFSEVRHSFGVDLATVGR